jgi:toxin ParE1/3/4
VIEVRLLPSAREELRAAAELYDAVAPGLGLEFLGEVERAIIRIRTFPEHGSPYRAETRRVVLRRFPFDVVYLQEAQETVIVAVAHHRRSPFYWRDRL